MRSVKTLIFSLLTLTLSISFAQTEVVWWDFLSGGDGVRMKAMIEEFNASHPDIQINATTLEWGVPFYTKVQTSAAVGEQPDIMTYHSSRYPLGVKSNVLRPISDEELASAGISKEDYFPNLVDAVTIDGQFYGVPLDIHSLILYYNKDLFAQAGLLDENGFPTGLTGIDTFNATLQTLQETTGVLPLSFGTDDAGTAWRVFYTLLNQQNDASLISDNEIMVGDAAANALSTIENWIASGYTPKNTSYEASVALFTSGQAAMHINGVWEVPTMTDLAANGELFEWGAIAIPVLFDHPATWADSHTFAIPHSEKSPISDEKVQAVLQVMAWMNQNSMMWASAGHIPAYLPVVNSDEYQALEPNATYAILGETASFDPQSEIAGVASPLYDAVENLLLPSMNGQLAVDQALEMFKQELESQLQ